MKLWRGALIFLVGLLSLAANVVAPTKSELEAMYAVAARALNAGQIREAIQQLDAIDARQPDMAAAKNLRGVALMRMGDYGVAERALQKARELDPGLWEVRFNLAEIPFLRKSWAEARHRFEALAGEKSEQAQGTTGDLIQFKILLTYLLEGKEKKAAEILERLQTSSASPAYYCGKAAFAFRHRDEKEAGVALKAAEKSFSPRLQKLFVESFYEVGWMEKPEGTVPVALENRSRADRAAQAQEDFGKAEQAYRQRDFEDALRWLDQVDASAPNQALSANLRGEILLAQGKADEAEAALRSALTANPQLLIARYNLARIPFKKRDYEAARKQLEAILGATSGGKQPEQREQLIKYQIFLTLLLEGRDAPAQKAMDEFKMMDNTPALYFAQAAWAFQHGNAKQGNVWVANAGNLYPEERTRAFAAPMADLGWLSGTGVSPSPANQAPAAVGATPSFRVAVDPRGEPPDTQVLVASIPETSDAPLEFTLATVPPGDEAAVTLLASTDEAEATSEPKASATPEKIAAEKKSSPRNDLPPRPKKNHRSTADKVEDPARSNRKARNVETARPGAPSPGELAPSPAPSTPPVAGGPRQTFGKKVTRFLLYPFQRRGDKRATGEAGKSASPEPTRSEN